jgi:hypothetical protein
MESRWQLPRHSLLAASSHLMDQTNWGGYLIDILQFQGGICLFWNCRGGFDEFWNCRGGIWHFTRYHSIIISFILPLIFILIRDSSSIQIIWIINISTWKLDNNSAYHELKIVVTKNKHRFFLYNYNFFFLIYKGK